MDDSSTAGVSRHTGDTVTQPSLGGTDNEQLLRQPFIDSKQPSELGEVLPREQDEDKGMGDDEMVFTPIPESASTPGDTSESSGHAKEESQLYSSAESRLVQGCSSEESSHDKLRPVSKDWVQNEIQKVVLNEIQKVKEDSKQERDKLSQQVSKLTVMFEKTNEELTSKKKELDQCQEELETFKKQVKDLTEELEHEVSTRTELEDKLKMSTEQVKQREDKIGELEVEVKKLQEELKKEKQNNLTAKDVHRLVKSNTDLVKELRQGALPPDPQHDRTIRCRNSARLQANAANATNEQDYVWCTICQDVWYQPVTLKGCGHTFCRHCILKQMQQRDFVPQEFKCSDCRTVINEQPMVYNAPAVRLLNAYFQQNPGEEKRLQQENKDINNEQFCRQYERLRYELITDDNEIHYIN